MSKLYSVWDVVKEQFSPPFIAENDNVAVRNFKQMTSTYPKELLDDFELFLIASEWRTDLGTLSMDDDGLPAIIACYKRNENDQVYLDII